MNNNVEKLQKLQKLAKVQQNGSRQVFKKVAVYLGAEPKEHFPKLKDAEGNNLKNEDGTDKKSDKKDGYTYGLSEIGTSKLVKIVVPSKINLNMLGVYVVSGYGFNINSANMYFLDSQTAISEYK